MRFMVPVHARSERGLPMNLTLVGTSRCDVPAREAAGSIIAPLSAARTAQRAVPTRFRVQSAKISWNSFHEPSLRPRPPGNTYDARTEPRDSGATVVRGA